jgi:ferredoxin-NADP reductase
MSQDPAHEIRRARVVAVRDLAIDVRGYELAPADGRRFPQYSAGSHIDVHVPAGLVRQYSLYGPGDVADRYLIAVKREPVSRGGSVSMHDDVEVGSVLAIGTPRNYFALAPTASRSLLVAGGIGITPIYSMAQTLAASGAEWTLHYCARSEGHAALYAEAAALAPGRVVAHFSEVPILDVVGLLAGQPAGTHVYCCGPVGLMTSVKAATSDWDESRVHFEWFAAPAGDHALDGSFEVELRRSGVVLTVPADRTILEVVREHGIDAPSSCEQGVCGTCETRLLEGDADHRDLLLTTEERAANRSIMICVSRSRSKRLVLDL